MPEAPRVYLDANVYLAWIRGEEGRVDTARELLAAGEQDRLAIVASTLLYAEVCGHGEVRSADDAEVDAKIGNFFDRGFIRWVELDLPIARLARTLSRSYRLRGADAVHLASAIRGRAERFMTWDSKDFPISQNIDGMIVQEPEAYGQGALSFE